VIENPDTPVELCWALQEGVEPPGDTSGGPMWNAPENEREEPTAPMCSSDLKTPEQCEAAGGVWTKKITNAEEYCKCD